MPANISIQSGIAAGTSFWIDRAVVRIGSDPQCDICLPTAELPPHALTVEYRDGDYRAYNRGSAPVTVGAVAVAPGASEIWRGEQTLHLPGDLRLVLQIDGDPRPSAKPEMWTENGELAEAPLVSGNGEATSRATPAATKSSSKTLVQLGVIVVAVLGMAAMLTMRSPSGESNSPQRPTFDGIVQTLLDKEGPARDLLPKLQYAEAAVVRDHEALARARFLKLRDQLVRLNDRATADDREDLERMLAYVEYRLGTFKTK